MTIARRAAIADVAELIRLRAVMFDSLRAMDSGTRDALDPAARDGVDTVPRNVATLAGDPAPGDPLWADAAVRSLRRRLADGEPTLAAFVVEHPSGAGLVACALGTVEDRLAGPNNPSGRTGHVFNVATDPAFRRQGYAHACLVALLAWYAQQGITKIDLHGSPEGEPLYRSLGFARLSNPAMRLKHPP